MAIPIQNNNETTPADDHPVRKVWSAPKLLPIDVVDVTNNSDQVGSDGVSATDRS
ncbi:MAG TPA: hypothetical protein VJ440_09810 [Candidatus Brocadiaceae bacterium]|nr:hypothetical protein [Candidatus Brocadiaceae bacterium]